MGYQEIGTAIAVLVLGGIVLLAGVSFYRQSAWLREPTSLMGKTARNILWVTVVAAMVYALVPSALRAAPEFMEDFDASRWADY